jgi:hypothetical protein
METRTNRLLFNVTNLWGDFCRADMEPIEYPENVNLGIVGQLHTELSSKFVLSSMDDNIEEQYIFDKITELSLDGVLKVSPLDTFTLYISLQSVWQKE